MHLPWLSGGGSCTIKIDPEGDGRAKVVPPLTERILAQPDTATGLNCK